MLSKREDYQNQKGDHEKVDFSKFIVVIWSVSLISISETLLLIWLDHLHRLQFDIFGLNCHWLAHHSQFLLLQLRIGIAIESRQHLHILLLAETTHIQFSSWLGTFHPLFLLFWITIDQLNSKDSPICFQQMLFIAILLLGFYHLCFGWLFFYILLILLTLLEFFTFCHGLSQIKVFCVCKEQINLLVTSSGKCIVDSILFDSDTKLPLEPLHKL